MEELIRRPLTVAFPISGVPHERVLESATTAVNPTEIRAIQITERTCLITVKTTNAREQLVETGLEIRGHRWFPQMVDSDITNITIKDAPVELSDTYLCTQMMRYGQVIQGSMRRGKIKATEIENGTRYLKMSGIKQIIPVNAQFGRFHVRIFCDNNNKKSKLYHV